MFKREEDLLVAIHEGKNTVGERHASAFQQLLYTGLVSGTEVHEGSYADVALTQEGKARIAEIIMRD